MSPKNKRFKGLRSISGGGSWQRRPARRLHLEPLEPRQLMAAQVVHGVLDDFVNYYPSTRSQSSSATGFLSAPSTGGAAAVSLNYLKQSSATLGVSTNDATSSVVTSSYTDSGTGISHVYYQQTYNGLPVLDATASVNVMPNGQVITAAANYVSGLASSGNTALNPTVTATAAVTAFATAAQLPTTSSSSVSQTASGRNQKTVLQNSSISSDPIPVELVYVPSAAGGTELAWKMVVRTPDQTHWYDAAVGASGARAGQVLRVVDWVEHLSSYTVFPQDPVAVQDPLFGNRATVVDPENLVASPFGWHDLNFVPGPELFTTAGNNVFATPEPALGVPPPNGGPNLTFNFPFNPAGTITPPVNIDASVTNLFYWANLAHDVNYNHGFDEVSGNFQFTNRSGAGLGGDAIDAVAQFLGPNALNNAFMATPPDGQQPLLAMGLFNTATPFRDSDFDATIVLHEATHGTSNRLTGGPANAGALQALQSRGMGEGWSDWYAMLMTMNATDNPATPRTTGNWVLNQSVLGPGVRRFPYSYDMTIDPLTAANFNGDIVPGAFFSEVHNAGEIWCSVLWDMTWQLINKYGFSADLNAKTGGQNKALDLVYLGMKLQPTNPSFQNARDAILAADFALNAGSNYELIWRAFARRGFGASFIDPGPNAFAIFPAFDQPLAAGRVQGTVFSDPNANAKRDTGELPLAGVTVYNDGNNNQVLDANEVQTVTDTNGFYSLAFANQQTVHIRQSLPSTLIQTFPTNNAAHTLQVNLNQTITGKDFGNLAAPGAISGTKFNDLDADAFRDINEPGIAGITIFVDLNNDGRLSVLEPAAVTDYFGNYTIRSLPPGNGYIVRELAQPGGVQTLPGPGAVVPFSYIGIVVLAGETTPGIDFGNSLQLDFGDAPDTYGTTLSRNGARSGILPGFQLGGLVDFEADGIPTVAADGDDKLIVAPNVLSDEDGVFLFGGGISPGQPANIQVTVSLGTNRVGTNTPGKLQAWVDFNQNGFFDASEKVVSNLRLGEGVWPMSFVVPQNAVLGTTYARFRYGYETDLGPLGPQIAGEVEDYAVTVLPNTPIANPDEFIAPLKAKDFPLDVVANDIRTLFGLPVILDSDEGKPFPITLASGSVIKLDAVNNRLLYTAGPNVVAGGEETFTYRVTDGRSKSNTATVTIRLDIRAVDDTYNINPLTDVIRQDPNDPASPVIATGKTVSPLINDAFLAAAPARILSVTAVTANPQTSVTINAADPTKLDFRATTLFRGTEIYTYTITDNDPSTTDSSATITFQVMPPGVIAPAAEDQLRAAGYLAQLKTEILSTQGNPISVIDVGQQFVLRVSSNDLRVGGTTANRGVETAYLDLLLNPLVRSTFMAPVLDANNPLGFAITFNPSYNDGQSGGIVTLPGGVKYVDEVGAFQKVAIAPGSIEPDPNDNTKARLIGLGPDDVLVFEIRMQALAPTLGQSVQIVPDPADDQTHPVELMPDNGTGFLPIGQIDTHTISLRDEQVFLVPSSLTILGNAEGEFVNHANPLDVNADTEVAPSDALTVINTINTLGSLSLRQFTIGGSIQWLVDANMDSSLTAADALVVINYLNDAAHAGAGLPISHGQAGGEGEGASAADADLVILSTMTDPAASGQPAAAVVQPLLVVQSAAASSDSASDIQATPDSDDTAKKSSGAVDATAADELFAALWGEGESRLTKTK